MSCCCSSATASKRGRQDCPECEKPCLSAIKQIMLHQVQFPDNQSIPEGDYAFCANRNCATGYFSASTMIPKSTLQTFQAGEVAMLCYCFDISEATYRTALGNGTAQAIKTFVVQQTKAALCTCESRNPSGRCCLADFGQIEKTHDY